MNLLRIIDSVNETSAPYNQFTLAHKDRYKITLVSFFRPQIPVPVEIDFIPGDSTLPSFIRNVRNTLIQGSYNVIHIHSPHVGFLFLLICIATKPTLLRNAVYTIHSSYPNYKLHHRLMLVWVFCLFRRIISCSHASYASFPTFYNRLAGNRFMVIPNGVDIERIDRTLQTTQLAPDRDRFTITTIGRLIELKQPQVALEAFFKSQPTNDKLRFIGEGHMRSLLVEASEAKGLEQQVEITGIIPREEVYFHLTNSDLYISTSTVEGLPVAVLEAMACCCPVILSDIPAHREIADGNEFIPLVKPDDIENFGREITRFRHMSSKQRAEIGKKCRKLVEVKFSLQGMHLNYEQIYHTLTK